MCLEKSEESGWSVKELIFAGPGPEVSAKRKMI